VTLTYRLAGILVPPLLWLYFRIRVRGRRRVPRSDGLLVVANHTSHLDPVLVGYAALPRDLHFFARSNLFKPRLFGGLIRRLQAVPVARGQGDREALQRARALLEEGKALVVFPEGTRSADGRLGEAKPGVGLLALQAGVPIICAHISGAHRAFPRGAKFPRPKKIRIEWGEPRTPEDWRERGPAKERPARAIAEALMAELASLGGQSRISQQNTSSASGRFDSSNPQGLQCPEGEEPTEATRSDCADSKPGH
jgi:1-acyl-sn-glycerol-3-phosphate acyltransferase